MSVYKRRQPADTPAVARRRAVTLFGRESDLERAHAALREGARFIAVVGLPGVGKSAFLDAFARELAEHGRRVHRGLAGSPDAGPTDVVIVDEDDTEAAKERSSALYSVVSAGTPVFFSAAAPPGGDERVLRLSPLPVPARDADEAAVFATASAQLLVAAARRLDVDLRLDTPAAIASFRAVLRAASGLPLALELAAAHLSVVSLDEIADALGRPSGFGAGGRGKRPARHATLGAAFERVLSALPTDAQARLLHAAPFLGGVEAPLAGTAELGAMRALVDLGLVEREPEAGRSRLRVPTLVGRLVLERASEEQRQESARRHLEVIAQRAASLVADYELRGDRAALARLDGLADDVEATLSWAEGTRALDAAIIDDAVCAATASGRARSQSTPDATLARLEALARRLEPPPRDALVRLAIERAGNAERETRVEDARLALERGASLAEQASGAARCELAMARGRHALAFERDYVAARAFFEQAAASADAGVRGRALVSRGNGFAWGERYDEAAEEYAKALEVIRGMGASRLETIVLTNLCLIHAGHWPSERSRTPRTVRLADGQRAVGLFLEAGDRLGVGIARTHVAITATTVLRFESAEDEFLAALESLGDAGSPSQMVVALADLGDVRHALGDDAGAASAYARAGEIADRAGDRLLAAVVRAQLGSLAIERNEPSAAAEHFDAARDLLEDGEAHANQLGLLLAQRALLDRERAGELVTRAKRLVGEAPSAHRHAVDLYDLLVAHRGGALERDRLLRVAVPWVRATMRLMRAPEEGSRGEDGYGIPWHVWVAVRRLMRELDDAARREVLVAALGLADASRVALVLDVDRRALRAGGAWIDLGNRARPFLLLTVLADAAHEGTPRLGVSELVARVWPDERMLPTAGANRVYAAISTLRKAGDVPELIVRDAEGYRLAPGVEIALWRDRYQAHRTARVVASGPAASPLRTTPSVPPPRR